MEYRFMESMACRRRAFLLIAIESSQNVASSFDKNIHKL